MVTKALFFIGSMSLLLFAATGTADEPALNSADRGNESPVAEQSQEAQEAAKLRHLSASQELQARMAEFKAGRTPANVVIQANRRLLQASRAVHGPSRADHLKYDGYAKMIEETAEKNLSQRVGTKHDVELAKAARLDAIRGDFVEPSAPEKRKN